MKFFKWLMKSIFLAFLIIFAVNVIGSFININIPLNIWTFLIILLLRIPGAIILIVFFLL